MFSCKVCAEKDLRLVTLASEVAFLRSLVRPPAPKNSHRPSAEQLEADALFSGETTQIVIDEDSRLIERSQIRLNAEDEAALIEREQILSGSY